LSERLVLAVNLTTARWGPANFEQSVSCALLEAETKPSSRIGYDFEHPIEPYVDGLYVVAVATAADSASRI